jgi:exosome complex component RRP40
MSVVLPGELIDPPYKKLNAGPGLFHLSNVSDGGSIISTRAGVLNHSANGRQWWIQSNSRRVRGCILPYPV